MLKTIHFYTLISGISLLLLSETTLQAQQFETVTYVIEKRVICEMNQPRFWPSNYDCKTYYDTNNIVHTFPTRTIVEDTVTMIVQDSMIEKGFLIAEKKGNQIKITEVYNKWIKSDSTKIDTLYTLYEKNGEGIIRRVEDDNTLHLVDLHCLVLIKWQDNDTLSSVKNHHINHEHIIQKIDSQTFVSKQEWQHYEYSHTDDRKWTAHAYMANGLAKIDDQIFFPNQIRLIEHGYQNTGIFLRYGFYITLKKVDL